MLHQLVLPSLLAQVGKSPVFNLPPPLFWFGTGILLSATELLARKRIKPKYRFIALAMGTSALFVSYVLWHGSHFFQFDWQRMDYEGFDMQVFYWMGVSLALVIWIRPMFFRWQRPISLDATEAETLTELAPGQLGRVLYEGSSWPACCENYATTIAPHQRVYVLRREGNTLIVAPESLFHP